MHKFARNFTDFQISFAIISLYHKTVTLKISILPTVVSSTYIIRFLLYRQNCFFTDHADVSIYHHKCRSVGILEILRTRVYLISIRGKCIHRTPPPRIITLLGI